jgi:hypothetical protein
MPAMLGGSRATSRDGRGLESIVNKVVHLMDTEVKPLCAKVKQIVAKNN